MRRFGQLLGALVVGASLVFVTATAAPAADVTPQQQRNIEQGEKLVARFLDALHPEAPRTALASFLSPAFLIQRADGTWFDKAGYLDDPAVVESYEIQDLWATKVGDNLVTRYNVVVESTIDGKQQATDPAPRMSVFVKGDKGWQLLAHSNFNALAADTPPTT